MTKNCIVCGRAFRVFDRDVANSRGKYCSHECYLVGHKAKMVFMKCDNCGKEIYTPTWRQNKSQKHRFCSKKCCGEYKKIHPVEFPNKVQPRIAQELTEGKLKEEYIANHKTIQQIAKQFGCNYGVVHLRLIKWDIPRRTNSDYSPKNSHAYWQKNLNKELNHTCEICGWNKTVCDIHHKIRKVDGGQNIRKNIVLLCPNCHRLVEKNLLKI